MHREAFVDMLYAWSTTFYSSQNELIRLDENNYQVWKDMSLAILKNSPNNIDVSLTFVITDLTLLNTEQTSKVLFSLQGWKN